VRVRVDGGGVRVSEVEGELEIRTSEGAIEASWVKGDLEGRTGGGRIEVRHLSGSCRLRSESGAIEISDATGRVEARTERGSVAARFEAEPSGALESGRGDVEVEVPADARLRLDARSRRGTVELAGLALDGERAPDRAAGALNGDGPLLRLFASEGGVRVSGR
jgi:DUF4097 and DUF4098 domain-containing protein YvlB